MKITMRRTLILYALLCSVLAFSAFTCSSSDVKRTSLKRAHEVEIGLGTAFDTVENLRTNGLIPVDKERTSILQIQKVNQAVLAFNTRARLIDPAHVTESDKQGLISAWRTVLDGLHDPAILAAAGVKSPQTRLTLEMAINGVLATAQSVMNTLQAIKVTA